MRITIPDRFTGVLRQPESDTHVLGDDGTYPNNELLPVIVYREVFREPRDLSAHTVEKVFEAHRWTGTWRNGIFSYHHYHSTAHEVLGVVRGAATVQLGGPDGVVLDLSGGDVVILPAGIAHKNLGSASDFRVVGAYPPGQRWDVKRGDPEDRPEADRNIEAAALPASDPVFGSSGLLPAHWHHAGDGS